MRKLNSIKKNFIYNLIYSMLSIIIPLISAPYTSRVLGADKIGIYSYTHSLIATVIMLGALGSATYGQKEIAAAKTDDERNHYFWEIFIIKTVTTVVGIILFYAYASFDRYFVYFVLQCPLLIAALLDISWLFQGVEKFNYIAIRNSVIRIAGIVLLFILVKNPGDLWKYLLIIGLSQMIGNLSMWPYAKLYINKPVFDRSRLKMHLSNMMVYFLPSIAYQIYAVLDKAMLGWIVGSDYENGFYEQAHKIIDMVTTVISAYTVVMTSRMSYLYSIGDEKEIQNKLYQAFNLIAFLVFPMSLGLALISSGVVPWFFGDGYEKVIEILYVFCPIFVFLGYSRLIGTHILTPSGRQIKSSMAQVYAALANLVLNMLLIPRYKAMGAALGSVGAEFLIVVVYWFAIRKEMSIFIVIKTGWKKLLSAIIMFFSIYPITKKLPISILSSVLVVILGTLVYFISLIIMRDEFFLNNLIQTKNKLLLKIKK